MRRDKKKKPGLSWIERKALQLLVNWLGKYIVKHMKGSWKTTIGGAIGALGTFLTTVQDPPWVAIVGQVLVGLGMFIIGASARDNKVSSEEAGAK